MPVVERSVLRVEGADDAHAIKHLLRIHGRLCPVRGETDGEWSENAPTIMPVGSDTELLEGMATAVRFSTGPSVGFVLDADEIARDRWGEVCERIRTMGLSLPSEIPTRGYVANSVEYRTRVGVWLMPDNRRSGALEAFLHDTALAVAFVDWFSRVFNCGGGVRSASD